MVRCVSHRHTLSHTRSQSHWGWRVGAGSGRQLRKRPRSPPSLPPYPPSCFLAQCQRPGRLGRGPGTARPRGGSRRRETRSRHSPGPSQGGGPRAPPKSGTSPATPMGDSPPPPHPETAPAPSWDSTWSALTTTPPSWNPTVETAASLGHDPSDL